MNNETVQSKDDKISASNQPHIVLLEGFNNILAHIANHTETDSLKIVFICMGVLNTYLKMIVKLIKGSITAKEMLQIKRIGKILDTIPLRIAMGRIVHLNNIFSEINKPFRRLIILEEKQNRSGVNANNIIVLMKAMSDILERASDHEKVNTIQQVRQIFSELNMKTGKIINLIKKG